jgi:flagellar protein FliS
MRQNFYRNYMETEILNADPVKLVCLLYRGAIERVCEARQCLRRGDIAGRARAITKATAILNELMLSLNREKGGEIARSLVELYDYIVRCLNDANFRQADGPLAEAEQLLNTLVGAWEESCQVVGGTAGADVLYAPISCAG